jgi:hypothetical protein
VLPFPSRAHVFAGDRHLKGPDRVPARAEEGWSLHVRFFVYCHCTVDWRAFRLQLRLFFRLLLLDDVASGAWNSPKFNRLLYAASTTSASTAPPSPPSLPSLLALIKAPAGILSLSFPPLASSLPVTHSPTSTAPPVHAPPQC